MSRVLGLGAGGHAKVVIEILRAAGGYDLVGLLDPRRELWGTEVLGVPVLGDDDLLPAQYDSGVRSAFVGLGSRGDLGPRRRLYERVHGYGFSFVAAVHPAAVVSPSAELGEGPTIAALAVIGPGARLGDDVLVNTAAIIEHDCVLGDHVHVASGARLGGGVTLCDGVHIGLGASVNPGLRVGDGAVVGSGSVVVEDVGDGQTVVGIPARPLRREG